MGFFSRGEESTPSHSKLSDVLRERGYVYQHTAPVEEIVDGAKRTLYLGIDPTADSMHVGHLQAMLVLRRFLEHGHKVILLLGGGTGMIGDPSGKSEERTLLTEDVLRHNAEGVRMQAKQLFSSGQFRMMNNLDWLGKLRVIDFLRDIGKHFSVNAMMQRDSVKDRLESREQGISYTEFSYMLLQSYDFLHLHAEEGCDLQIGASDQWGNMVSGVDLIRRKTGNTAYAFSFPLLVNKATGKKFGKTEGGAVWLDPEKTTPFQFYQFWFNTADSDTEEYLLKMTLVPKAGVDALMQEQQAHPAARAAQKRLAWEVTALVHGERIAQEVKEESEALFGGKGSVSSQIPDVAVVAGSPVWEAAREGLQMSRTEFVRLVAAGGVALDETKITDAYVPVTAPAVLRVGKNRFLKIEIK